MLYACVCSGRSRGGGGASLNWSIYIVLVGGFANEI